MVKLGRTKQEDRGRAAKYAAVGRSLLYTARDLDTMGEEKYGNGLAIVVIHAAIAYTDALTVAHQAIKSTAGDHAHAANVLLPANHGSESAIRAISSASRQAAFNVVSSSSRARRSDSSCNAISIASAATSAAGRPGMSGPSFSTIMRPK